MKFDPQKPFEPAQGRHHRRSIRLQGFDYSQPGAYYITIVAYQRQHLFGEAAGGEMRLNEFGQIACNEWFKTAQLRRYVKLYEEELIVMPNHVHGIIWIEIDDGGNTPAIVGARRPVGARRRRAPTLKLRPEQASQSMHDCRYKRVDCT